MAVYLLVEGAEKANIEGVVTAKGYEKNHRVESIQLGIGRGISMEVGNLANRDATKPSFSEVTFTKKADESTIGWFKAACGGAKAFEVTISFVQTDGDQLKEYMTYKLKEVLVSGYSTTGDFDTDSVETISLSYSDFEVKYTPHDKSNKPLSPKVGSYSLTEAKYG